MQRGKGCHCCFPPSFKQIQGGNPMIDMGFRLDGNIGGIDYHVTYFRLLGLIHFKNLSVPTNINNDSGNGKKICCAKPTIRKKNTVNIEGVNGEKVSFDILDPNYLDMQNGHKFITGVVYEKRGQ